MSLCANINSLFCWAFILALQVLAQGQTPFERKGQNFLLLQASGELVEMYVHPNFQTLQFSTISTNATGLNALAFRSSDNLLYAINENTNELLRLDANGSTQTVGNPPLDNALFYLAADISPDGKWMACVGSNAAGDDVHLALIDLESAALDVTFISIGGTRMVDLAFDPYSGDLWGFDDINQRFVKLDMATGGMTPLSPIFYEDRVSSFFFDAFGDLYAYGPAVNGIVDAIFTVNKNTGAVTRWATGPLNLVADGASCPYSVEIKNAVSPEQTLPCEDAKYTLNIANASGVAMYGIRLEFPLPPGIEYVSTLQNPFGGTLDAAALPGTIRLEGMSLPGGVGKIILKVHVGDIAEGTHNAQAQVQNLPSGYGGFSPSDNPVKPGYEDSTRIDVNRFEEDSLAYAWFVCHEDTIILDASEFGGDLEWNNGATTQMLPVWQAGLYSLAFNNGCEELYVEHEVTSASCPFTIEVQHLFEPDTIFPCSELKFRFIFENTSGEVREDFSFIDYLPEGFTFLQILDNPFGGSLVGDSLPGQILMHGMTLHEATDTLDILVEAGDILPGKYRNQATMFNLQEALGPLRWSDDPRTIELDSTLLQVLGTLGDSVLILDTLCFGTPLNLDATGLGKDFLWDDGSTGPLRTVEQAGDYLLTLFDGCEPSVVTFRAIEGEPISIQPIGPLRIHQGESVQLAPTVTNQGAALIFTWTDSLGGTLSCLDCPSPSAMPLQSTTYGLKVDNLVCTDSLGVLLEVDERRRIYAPNVFSPNYDGFNDYFFLQSPDYGAVHSLRVFDRWGNGVFSVENPRLNEALDGWDGRRQGKPAAEGVYAWMAEIEFVDGKREVFSGDILLLR